jgi:hypothetical protein
MAIALISMKRKELYTFDTIDMIWRVQGNYLGRSSSKDRSSRRGR